MRRSKKEIMKGANRQFPVDSGFDCFSSLAPEQGAEASQGDAIQSGSDYFSSLALKQGAEAMQGDAIKVAVSQNLFDSSKPFDQGESIDDHIPDGGIPISPSFRTDAAYKGDPIDKYIPVGGIPGSEILLDSLDYPEVGYSYEGIVSSMLSEDCKTFINEFEQGLKDASFKLDTEIARYEQPHLLEQSVTYDFISHTFSLLSDNFIISTYDKLTQVRRDHLMILLAKIIAGHQGVVYDPLEVSVQDRYSDLEYLPLSDGKSVLYRSDILLSFILNNVQFEDFWNKVNSHKDKKDILTTIFLITSDICSERHNEKQKLQNIYVSLPQYVTQLKQSEQDDLVFIFCLLGFDQDTIVKQYLLNLKQNWAQLSELSVANKDALGLVLDFFPYEEYKKVFKRSFDSFQNERYVLSEPVFIDDTLFNGFEKQLFDQLPQTIFQATTFQHYLDLYNKPRALRALLKFHDISDVTNFQKVMLAAKATMLDYEKEFSDLKVKKSTRKLLSKLSHLEVDIKRSHFYDEFCTSIDRFMPKRFKGIDLLEKLEYLKLNLNNLVNSGEVYDLYQNLDKVSLFDNRVKLNFPKFAINDLLKSKANSIIKIIDTTPTLFEIISSNEHSEYIFATINFLIPKEFIEEFEQNSIEVFKQKLAYLKKEIAIFVAGPSDPKPSTDQEFTEYLAETEPREYSATKNLQIGFENYLSHDLECFYSSIAQSLAKPAEPTQSINQEVVGCLDEPELRKSSSTEYLQIDHANSFKQSVDRFQQEISECLTAEPAKPAEPKQSINKEVAEFLAEFDPKKSSLTTDKQINRLYDCFYCLGLCPNLELADNSKLTTHISKYIREDLSSFSSLANSISSYDQEVRADSPSSCASDESAGRYIGNLTHPIFNRSSSFAR